MDIRNIIFDFDHTLVELGPHVEWKRAIRDIEAIYLEEGISLAIVQRSRGLGFWLMREVYDHMLVVLPSNRAREIQSRVFATLENYELRGVILASPMEGVLKLLTLLGLEGFKCAIVSSNGKHTIVSSLDNLNLTDCFDGVFGRDPAYRLKPYPDQNRVCLNTLGWKAKETLLVGDSPDDILSAKSLSIRTVGVIADLGKRDQLVKVGADHVIGSLIEFPSVIERL